MLDVILVGFALIVVGIVVILASVVSDAEKGSGRVRGGGVLLIGPIPVVFGSDAKWASVALVLAIVLMALSLLIYLG